MRTDTRARLLVIIGREGSRRPVELIRELGLTGQAIHRHLRRLVEEGTLEVLGRGPRAHYVLAGAPRLEGARAWYCAGTEPSSPDDFVCQTRDALAARQSRLRALAKEGADQAQLPLLIAVAGEIGNNCFDHNLGNWRDQPGCWFETQMTGGRLWLCIADRGQGVFRSLTRTQHGLADEPAALSAAFEKHVSGRAPEKRGNGLKFVRSVIAEGARGLACRSGAALVEYGSLGAQCARELSRWVPNAGGTATLILWSLK